MYTYDDIHLFQETLTALALLKIAHDNGVDLTKDSELAIDFHGNFDTGYTDQMYYFQEIVFKTFEIVEFLSGNDYDHDDDEPNSDFKYWMEKIGYDFSWSESLMIFLIMDDRLNIPKNVYTTRVNTNSWDIYFDVAELPDDKAIIVLFDMDNGEPNTVEALQYLFACLDTKKVQREDTTYAVAN